MSGVHENLQYYVTQGRISKELSKSKSGADAAENPLFSQLSKDTKEYPIGNPLKIKDSTGDEIEVPVYGEDVKSTLEAPNMWTKDYVGLYAQYAAVGLLYGSVGTLFPLCFYVYEGPSNLCANASNVVFFAWNIKILFAILTDVVR